MDSAILFILVAFAFNSTLLIENEDTILPICYDKQIWLEWCDLHYADFGDWYGDKIQ